MPQEHTQPIALRKGMRSSRNPYPYYNFLSYHRLSPSYYAFFSSVSNVFIPKTASVTKADHGWQQAIYCGRNECSSC